MHVVVQFSQHHLLKRLSFFRCVFLPLFRLIAHISMGSFWAFYSFPLIYVSVSVPVPYCFDDCSSVAQFEVREHDTSSFVLLKIGLAIWGLLCFHTNLKIICFSSVNNAIGI